MATRKRHVGNQNGRQVNRQSRKRKSRRKRRSDMDWNPEFSGSGSEAEFSDSDLSPLPPESQKTSTAKVAPSTSGVRPLAAASVLILLILLTGGVYVYNFVDMSRALDTLQSRLATIVTPQTPSSPKQAVPESPPGGASEPVTSSAADDISPSPPSPATESTADAPPPPTIITEKPKKKKPYANKAITNSYDNKFRRQLDDVDAKLAKGLLNEALGEYDQLLAKYPQSARARYGRAQALDKLSEKQRSNSLLEQSIEEYSALVAANNVPKELHILAGKRCSDRQTFRGWTGKAVRTLSVLVKHYPEEIDLLNDLGINYLIAGRNDDARNTFQKVLDARPDDGLALVHYGFILKTIDQKMPESIDYLQRGIETGDPGTMEGRFIVHLGDAYYRNGQQDKSYETYKLGAQNGLFRNYWQRSLYNVDHLTGRPFWTMEQTKVMHQLKVLKKHWRTIRDEGMAQLNPNGKFNFEDENLRSQGEWKQLTLFARGRRKADMCALAPKTCALIDQFPESSGCTRGQVKFSVMQPGTHVWPHCGPTNCRIRAHLGLVVPDGPQIRVANETRTWKEGEFTIFDDSFEHEVWHDGESLRLVLIVDLWHPDLTPSERQNLSPI